MRPKAEWAITSEAMRVSGIIVLVKSKQLVKNIETKQLKARLKSFLPPKIRRFSLLVGYNIQPSSSSTNQNAALIIDQFNIGSTDVKIRRLKSRETNPLSYVRDFRRSTYQPANSRRISGGRFSPSEKQRRERSDNQKCVCCSQAKHVLARKKICKGEISVVQMPQVLVIILFVQLSFQENNFLSSDFNLPLLIFICNICDRNKRNVQRFIHSKHIRLLIVLGTCLHGGGGLQVGEVTRLSIQSVACIAGGIV